jgi:kynurenine formamidase
MPVLSDLLSALASGRIEIVDLTSPLRPETPILRLPEPFANTIPFRLEEISRYDDRGPAWYWNDIHTGEHTGTHFDAPVHWITGRDGEDISQVSPAKLIAPAVMLDFADEATKNDDFVLEIEHVRGWEAEHGALPEQGWLLLRTGWESHGGDQREFLNDGHSPGVSANCAQWLAEKTSILGIGVETVGTDAGAAPGFEPPFPCHSYLLGAGKYGLTQLRRLGSLPATGFALFAAPLPIVGGSGSPTRVLALVER